MSNNSRRGFRSRHQPDSDEESGTVFVPDAEAKLPRMTCSRGGDDEIDFISLDGRASFLPEKRETKRSSATRRDQIEEDSDSDVWDEVINASDDDDDDDAAGAERKSFWEKMAGEVDGLESAEGGEEEEEEEEEEAQGEKLQEGADDDHEAMETDDVGEGEKDDDDDDDDQPKVRVVKGREKFKDKLEKLRGVHERSRLDLDLVEKRHSEASADLEAGQSEIFDVCREIEFFKSLSRFCLDHVARRGESDPEMARLERCVKSYARRLRSKMAGGAGEDIDEGKGAEEEEDISKMDVGSLKETMGLEMEKLRREMEKPIEVNEVESQPYEEIDMFA